MQNIIKFLNYILIVNNLDFLKNKDLIDKISFYIFDLLS